MGASKSFLANSKVLHSNGVQVKVSLGKSPQKTILLKN